MIDVVSSGERGRSEKLALVREIQRVITDYEETFKETVYLRILNRKYGSACKKRFGMSLADLLREFPEEIELAVARGMKTAVIVLR